MTKQTVRSAFYDSLPIMTGYVVLSIGFGIMMNSLGYGILWSVAMSLFVYAGSMQYAALGLFADNVSLLTVALTTLAVNARHLFYGISMVENYRGSGAKKPYMIFSLTDETYSLVCGGDKDNDYCFLVSLFSQCYWVFGTIVGSLIGSALNFNAKGIDFALTALFITVFADQWMNEKNHTPALIGVLVSVFCLLVFGADKFLVPAMLIIAVLLLIYIRRGKIRE